MKQILILTLVMLTLVSMTTVCASDVNDTTISNEDTTIINVSESNYLTDGNIVINPDNPQVNSNNSLENNEGSGKFGTFTELQDEIDNATIESTIILKKDYMYDDGFDINGISIGKPLTIDGNNHIINANSKSRIFSCSCSYYGDIILKNIIFVGGYTSGSGGAIYVAKGDPTIEGCKFVNNYADGNGGAIYSERYLSISKSEFVNNKATKGGGIYQISSNHYTETSGGEDYEHWDHYNLEITDNTKFINNSAAFGGGAICMHELYSILNPDYNGELYLGKNITFENNAGSSIISLLGPDFRINEANFINNHMYDDGSVIWVGDLVVNASIIKYPPGNPDFHDYYLDKVVFKDNSGKDIDGAISINGDVIRVKFDSSYNGKGLVNLISSHNSKDSHNEEWGMKIEGFESDFVNGVALFNINDIVNVLPGKYLLEICYANNKHASAIVPITLVKKVSTKLTANDVTTTSNVNKDLVVTLKDANGKEISGAEISIDLNGIKLLTTDINGQVKIATGSLAPNVYNAKITFAGDDNYVESAITVKVTVEKSTQKSDSGKSTTVKKQATKIIANNKNFKAKTKIKKYTVTLKTKAGKAIKNAQLIIKINKKTYKAKTNGNGKATFIITKLTKKGTHKSVITFKGNKNYNKISKTVQIKIK